ncbi:sensor domain-containing diguanylate cyclase [Acetobacterium tundrae]|uniref:Diguanylate cyclase n=1 Tax=Acetobacterium tundrae TaxID=132932 RepID=A0ABR6WHD0_9FIRM|nr:diguanylate cyclase [Acetobacterium tundrae]MBC3795879.1 diguanylate cyclase [Acetobacterium tundrae]
MNMEKFKRIILDNEDILMEKSLKYGKERNYTKYTSTLKEAWRLSIAGLSQALVKVIEKNDIPEMGPDDDFTKSEVAEFGIIEAQKHRSRGVTLGMFLGFMKYYQQAYEDLIFESDFLPEEKKYCSLYIKRYFDQVELGFAIEWSGLSENHELTDLQEVNRVMTNEKNKYLTIFESIYDPIILVDEDNNIENINYKAAEVFFDVVVSGMKYYRNINNEKELSWLIGELNKFTDLNEKEVLLEKTIETKEGQKTYLIKFKKMLDVSEKYRGTVILFNDITERQKMDQILKRQNEKLEYYAFTDPMTGVSNRRTGLMILEKELAFEHRTGLPLSICFLDIDGLKMVNDTFGHEEGDNLINCITTIIKSTLREIDTISRIGGDEFLVIFPGCFQLDVEKVITRINDELQEYDKKSEKMYQHAFSYGIIELTENNKLSVNDVINAADKKMYANKLKKKNREEIHEF